MSADAEKTEQVESLLATPDLASALESDAFLKFLDQVPIAIIVSALKGRERIVYANPEFEKVSGYAVADVLRGSWIDLRGVGVGDGDAEGDAERDLGRALVEGRDFVGTFAIEHEGRERVLIDAYSNVIEDDDGTPTYRLAALVNVGQHESSQREAFELQIRDKDMLLREIQHRVKNNLQLIAALMRIEARNGRGRIDTAPFDRLAGRIEAIQLLYRTLSDDGQRDEVDLGVYLSQIASSVLRSHGVEGISLDLKVDVYPVSVNVAMPTGLVVNELLTNALKYAFVGRDGGTITVHSLTDGEGCRVMVGDDGVGLPSDTHWPSAGKLSGLIVQSLRANAKADLQVESRPGQGMRVTIRFSRAAAAPE